MNQVKIALLESDPIDRIKIEIMVAEFTSSEYSFKLVGAFSSIVGLLRFLESQTVDIIICETFNKNQIMGIESLNKLKNNTTPIILITHSHDLEVYQKSKQYRYFQYLVKPFHKFTLQSTVENALFVKYDKQVEADTNKKFIFLKGNSDRTDRVSLDEILFLETNGNYCNIHTKKKKYIKKKSLNKILHTELDENFIRIHHRYAINKHYIQAVKHQSLEISGEIVFPIGKGFKKVINGLL